MKNIEQIIFGFLFGAGLVALTLTWSPGTSTTPTTIVKAKDIPITMPKNPPGIIPIKQPGVLCHNKGFTFHTDALHAKRIGCKGA